MVLGDMVCGGLDSGRAMDGFDNLTGLLQIKQFFDSMILDWILLVLVHWFTGLEECSLYAMLRIVVM